MPIHRARKHEHIARNMEGKHCRHKFWGRACRPASHMDVDVDRYPERTPAYILYLLGGRNVSNSRLPAAYNNYGKMGRAKSACWSHVKLLADKKGHPTVECKHCNLTFVGGASNSLILFRRVLAYANALLLTCAHAHAWL